MSRERRTIIFYGLLIGLVALTIASYIKDNDVDWGITPSTSFHAGYENGIIEISICQSPDPTPGREIFFGKNPYYGIHWNTFSLYSMDFFGDRDSGILFPTWFVMLILTGLYLLGNARENRKREYRMKRCLCFHCGYDLRGTSGVRCPECGEGYSQSGDAGIGEDGI